MAIGSKKTYSSKQKRQAAHIEDRVKSRGGSEKKAERIAWATVNKETGGGKKSGSGRGKKKSNVSSRKGGKIGGKKSKKISKKTTTKKSAKKSSAKRGRKKTSKS